MFEIAWGFKVSFRRSSSRTKKQVAYTCFPGLSRKEVRFLANGFKVKKSPIHLKVAKFSITKFPTCGCGIVDDVGVTCRKHTPKKGSR